MHIRVDDIVQVITGEDQIQAKVLKVLHTEQKVLVEGVNRVYKHMRKSQKNPQGGRLSKEMPIAISNVALVCTKCGKPTRTAAKYRDDGSKVRVCKKCKAEIGVISPAKASYAKKQK